MPEPNWAALMLATHQLFFTAPGIIYRARSGETRELLPWRSGGFIFGRHFKNLNYRDGDGVHEVTPRQWKQWRNRTHARRVR